MEDSYRAPSQSFYRSKALDSLIPSYMHLEKPTLSCSVAFSSILGPCHLQSIFSTWPQETGALGFWAFGGLR